MRKAGIIQKDVSIIDRNFIGRKITIVVQVLSDKEGIEYDDEFKKTMLKAPEVMQCYYVTGDYDYVLIATFAHFLLIFAKIISAAVRFY